MFEVFSRFGEIEQAYIVYNPRTHKSRGFGYVLTKSVELAEQLDSEGIQQIEKTTLIVKMHVPANSDRKHSSNNKLKDKFKENTSKSSKKPRSSSDDQKNMYDLTPKTNQSMTMVHNEKQNFEQVTQRVVRQRKEEHFSVSNCQFKNFYNQT